MRTFARMGRCNRKFLHGSALRTYREMGTVLRPMVLAGVLFAAPADRGWAGSKEGKTRC